MIGFRSVLQLSSPGLTCSALCNFLLQGNYSAQVGHDGCLVKDRRERFENKDTLFAQRRDVATDPEEVVGTTLRAEAA